MMLDLYTSTIPFACLSSHEIGGTLKVRVFYF